LLAQAFRWQKTTLLVEVFAEVIIDGTGDMAGNRIEGLLLATIARRSAGVYEK
jgi:hypothetical protein